jgi:hypothetical protein
VGSGQPALHNGEGRATTSHWHHVVDSSSSGCVNSETRLRGGDDIDTETRDVAARRWNQSNGDVGPAAR